MNDERRPKGVTALSLFFGFGAVVSAIAAVLLLFPGSLGDRTHSGFMITGGSLLMMALICAACIATSIGLWRCALWGFWAALVILSLNVAGDIIGVITVHDTRTLIGLPIGILLIWYLLQRRPIFA